MDDIIKHLIDTAGDTGVKAALGGLLTALAVGYKKVLSLKDKKAIEKAAEKMIRAATADEVLRYGVSFPVVRAAGGTPPAKKAPGKRVPAMVVHRKAARKISVTTKKPPANRPVTKKAAVKKSAPQKAAERKSTAQHRPSNTAARR